MIRSINARASRISLVSHLNSHMNSVIGQSDLAIRAARCTLGRSLSTELTSRTCWRRLRLLVLRWPEPPIPYSKPWWQVERKVPPLDSFVTVNWLKLRSNTTNKTSLRILKLAIRVWLLRKIRVCHSGLLSVKNSSHYHACGSTMHPIPRTSS